MKCTSLSGFIRRPFGPLAAAALLFLLCRAEAELPKSGSEDFIPLFNGKDLSGWVGDPELWQAQDGILVGSTDNKKLRQNSFLATEKKYSDFILKAKVKLRNHNSGIQFRSEQHPNFVLKGYQADVAEKDFFGMLYEEGKRGIMPYWKALPPEEQKAINAAANLKEWNDYEITCKGHHLTMVLNGKTVLDLEDSAGASEGVIGLQLHAGPPMRVEFKDISIKELK